MAAMTANLMNCWRKRLVTADDLLGIKRPMGDGYADRDPAGQAAMVERIAKKLERVEARRKKAKC